MGGPGGGVDMAGGEVLTGDKGSIQMGGREVAATGEEGFQMYFSDILGAESTARRLFGEELGSYKLVEHDLVGLEA